MKTIKMYRHWFLSTKGALHYVDTNQSEIKHLIRPCTCCGKSSFVFEWLEVETIKEYLLPSSISIKG